MNRATLYARVSSDAQQKEGTIESQVVELKRQIAATGHVLVREYIDDGITGTVLDRPALEQLRQDAKTDLFDRIYFLAADRIAREAASCWRSFSCTLSNKCGVCGSGCSSSRRYHKVKQPSGRVSVYHRSGYRCNRQARQYGHDLTQINRCRNVNIGIHILEGKVFEMIRDIMIDPGKLRRCIDGGRSDDRSTAQQLARIASKIGALDQERRKMIDKYAADQMSGEDYIAASFCQAQFHYFFELYPY